MSIATLSIRVAASIIRVVAMAAADRQKLLHLPLELAYASTGTGTVTFASASSVSPAPSAAPAFLPFSAFSVVACFYPALFSVIVFSPLHLAHSPAAKQAEERAAG